MYERQWTAATSGKGWTSLEKKVQNSETKVESQWSKIEFSLKKNLGLRRQ